MQINKNKTGLTFGFLISFFHLVWSLLVAFGLAQALLNFILSVHMIITPVMIMPFDFVKAITLVVVTFIVGYVFGWLMAFFWNKCFK
ncbi:MAG: hypothetical protein UR91_C0001G0003 [Candidatus Nomurabacteria bacterium GW2011_GWC2_35_8]|nr:MAG: hypothetical protein UR91_C0001G0003 [Candidatus Nomurabacteria bacterium GW2011_GWC2_35_8]